MNHKTTCCFTADTTITMADGTTKPITDIQIGEWVCSLNNEFREVGCNVENETDEYFILKSKQGYELKATGDHPILTNQGWKQMKQILKGDSVVRWDFLSDSRQYDEVTAVELIKEKRMMYNLICDDCAIIANGFVCGDFHIQYKLLFGIEC